MAKEALYSVPEAQDEELSKSVLAELSRVVTHELFIDTTRMKRFLDYVVRQTLLGNGDRLKGYTIGVEVFDRPESFDPQADTIVRVQAGQMRRRLDLYYQGDGRDNPVRILIPKGRYTPVFEMREQKTAEVTALSLLPDLHGPSETTEGRAIDPRPVVAVITFDNLSEGEAHDFFAQGLTAEIVNAMVQFRYLRIVTLTPSVMIASQTTDVHDYARDYEADFVLTGNVRRSGDVFRVNVSLISAETGEHVFSKFYDREYNSDNLFEIQEEIASYTAANIAAPFGAVNRYNRRKPAVQNGNIDVYEATLKYYEMNLAPTNSKAAALMSTFDTLTRQNRNYSTGWAIKSLLNSFLVAQSVPSYDADGLLPLALVSGMKASELDPENGLAYFALFQAYYHSGNFEMADEMMRKTLSRNPNNYMPLAYYGIMQAFRGNPVDALAYQNASLRLIGRPPIWFYTASMICSFQAQDFEKVNASVSAQIEPGASSSRWLSLASKGHLGLEAECTAITEKLEAKVPNFGAEAMRTFGYWHANPALDALVRDGLRKAGLDIPPAPDNK